MSLPDEVGVGDGVGAEPGDPGMLHSDFLQSAELLEGNLEEETCSS